MKKFLQLIALFALISTGAWAEDGSITVTSGNAKWTNNDGTYTSNKIWTSNATGKPVITITGASEKNGQAWNTGNGVLMCQKGADGLLTLTISIAGDYRITGFTFTGQNAAWTNNVAVKFSSNGRDVQGTSNVQMIVTDLNTVSTTITVITLESGERGKITDFVIYYTKLEDYTDNVNTNIKPWIESIDGGYFKLTSSNSDVANLLQEYNAHTSDTWTQGEYENLVSLLDAAKASEGAYLMPEAGYYLIKNTRYSKYVGFGTSSNSSKGNGLVLYSAICPATVLKLVKNGNKYTVSSQGLFGKQFPTNVRDQLLPFTNVEGDAKEFTFTPVDGNGNVAISTEPYTNPNNNNMTIGYWHGTSWDGVVSWTKDAEPSWFTVEDAIDKTFDITMNAVGGKNYATTYLPFPVVLSEAAAYTVKVNGKQAEYTLAGSEIPAGEAVLLISDNSETLQATVQNVTTPVGENALLGVYAKTAASDLTNPTVLNAVGEKIGFYRLAATSTLSANRAYLNYAVPEGAKEGFDLVDANETTGVESIDNAQFAIDNAPVYNLQGQRVVKAQKGVFIQNGKKVVVK